MNPRAKALIGTPYREGGDAPELGFDCWRLVVWARWHLYGLETPHELEGLDLATLAGRMAALERAEGLAGWHAVEPAEARDGDVVLMSNRGDGRPHHCGFLADADERAVLHAHEPIAGNGGQVYCNTLAALQRLFARVTVHQWRA